MRSAEGAAPRAVSFQPRPPAANRRNTMACRLANVSSPNGIEGYYRHGACPLQNMAVFNLYQFSINIRNLEEFRI